MKILRLKSKNINSLKGSVEIDFTDLLKQNALFAITGPTGSGKSTLLDVITCALYGQTPRLKNPNDLMSRHSGEAFCEVEFEVKKKLYRSSWTQKRARNKYDGKYQSAKMEISELESGKVLVTGLREVPKYIETLSGLDFDKFTQSMMLAQGSFDAFLKAKESKRSALLEKITGTKIYADISKAIYEKYIIYKNDIDSDVKSLENIELIDEEVATKKKENLAINKNKKVDFDKELNEINKAINSKQILENLLVNDKQNSENFAQITKEMEDKKDEFNKLKLANKALNITPMFATKQEQEKTIQLDENSSLKLTKDIKSLADEISQATKIYSKFQEENTQAKLIFDEQSTKLKQAKAIKIQEQEIQNNFRDIQKSITTKKETKKKLSKLLNQKMEEFNKLEIDIDKKNSYLQKNIKDKELISNLNLIEENLKKYKQEDKKLASTLSEKAKANIDLAQIQLSKKAIQKDLDILKIKNQEGENNYQEIVQKTSNDTKNEQSYQKKIIEIEKLLSHLRDYGELKEQKENELIQISLNSQKEKDLKDSIKNIMEHREELKKYIQTLREKKEQELLIKKYEQDREKLICGEACFLCGSKEHPYVKHINHSSIDETTYLIKEKELTLEQKELELNVKQKDETTLKTKIQTSNLEIEKLDNKLSIIDKIFQKSSYEISKESELNLSESLNLANNNLKQIVKRREQKDSLLKIRDTAALILKDKENDLSLIYNKLYRIETQIEQLNKNEEQSCDTLQELNRYLSDELLKYDIVFDKDSFELDGLILKKDTYLSTQEGLNSIKNELNDIKIDITGIQTKVKLNDGELILEQERVDKIDKTLKDLTQKRVTILNVENLDEYDKEINNKLEEIESKTQRANQKLQELKTRDSEWVKQLETQKSKISNDKEVLDSLSKKFDEQLKENGFEDTKHFTNSMMQTIQRDELSKICKNIEDKYNELKTLKEESKKRLDNHMKLSVTDKSIEILKELQQESQQKIDQLQLSIGRDEKEIELNNNNIQKHKEKISILQKKKDDFKVWDKLQELIGSADGNKFSKFAQGITLDQLITLANHHLNILSKRYKLIRAKGEKELLEIEVIDTFQANVIRPVATLSGGESFIVSLALALGLSELASQKISIDSLFLDEGFGALDGESLEIALNALNLLQSSGKMVGVISHVEALKERIPLQIKVIPKGDGTSFVEVIK